MTASFHEAPPAPNRTKRLSSQPLPDEPYADNHGGPPMATLSNADRKSKDDETSELNLSRYRHSVEETQTMSRTGSEGLGEGQESNGRRKDITEAWELKDRHDGGNLEHRDGTIGQSPQKAIKMIDTDKLKATVKRRRLRGDIAQKGDLTDEDDLIGKELEDGIELATERENPDMYSKECRSKPSSMTENDNSFYRKHHEDGGGHYEGMKRQSLHAPDLEKIGGEVSALNDASHHGSWLPKLDHKRKQRSPPENLLESKPQHDYSKSGSRQRIHHDLIDDKNRLTRAGHSEGDHKRHVHENHV